MDGKLEVIHRHVLVTKELDGLYERSEASLTLTQALICERPSETVRILFFNLIFTLDFSIINLMTNKNPMKMR